MKLTETETQLTRLLMQFIEDETSIIGVMLALKKEEQQEEMIDYIIDNKDNLTKQMIMKEMGKLIEKYK